MDNSSPLRIKWEGHVDKPEGLATISYEDIVILCLTFPTFSSAHAVYNAMQLCLDSGFENGQKDIKTKLNILLSFN